MSPFCKKSQTSKEFDEIQPFSNFWQLFMLSNMDYLSINVGPHNFISHSKLESYDTSTTLMIVYKIFETSFWNH